MTVHYRKAGRGAASDAILARTAHVRRSHPSLNPPDLARRIVDLLADRQAEEIVMLDLRGVASFTDYFVIATAENSRQMRALVETTAKELRAEGVRSAQQEGALDSGWVLIDYGDVIVHLFSPEQRRFYALEELWHEARPVVLIQ
jgi:ribosome-associated protein